MVVVVAVVVGGGGGFAEWCVVRWKVYVGVWEKVRMSVSVCVCVRDVHTYVRNVCVMCARVYACICEATICVRRCDMNVSVL